MHQDRNRSRSDAIARRGFGPHTPPMIFRRTSHQPRWALVLAAALVLATAQPGQAAAGDLSWANDQVAKANSEGFDIAVTPDGATALVAGWLVGDQGNNDYFVGAFSTNDGSTVWTKRYDDPTGGLDQATRVVIDPSGLVAYVSGAMTIKGNGYDIVTMAFDVATGTRLWSARFNGPRDNDDFSNGLAVSSNGVYVAGNAGDRSLLLSYSRSTGALRWKSLGQSGPWVDVVVHGKREYAVGYTYGPSSKIKLGGFTSAGLSTFQKGYVGPFQQVSGIDAALSVDGSTLFALGQEIQGNEMMIAAFDTGSGSHIWHKVPARQSGGFDQGGRIAVSPDGSMVYAAIESVDSHATGTFETIAYAAVDGTLEWGPIRENGFDDRGSPADIAVSDDGANVYVTGVGRNADGFTGFLSVAYDAAIGGPSTWEHWTPGPNNYAWGSHAVAVAPNNSRVFVTGSGDTAVHTEAYSTT